MGIDSVRFRGRHVSQKSVIFLVTGALCFIALPTLCIISASKGGAGILIGAIGFCAAIMCVIGLVSSIRTFKERDIYMGVPIAGMIVNGITLVCYFIVYFLGLS